MSRQHKVIVNTASRISGTNYDATIPIKISNILDIEKLKYVRLEWTSFIPSTTALNLFVASGSLSLPYTFNTNLDNETNILGCIPLKDHDSLNYVHQTVASDNIPIYSTNIASVLKSNLINIQLVDATGALLDGFVGEYTACLTFTEV